MLDRYRGAPGQWRAFWCLPGGAGAFTALQERHVGMKTKVAMACLAASLALTPATRVAADGGDVVGGLIAGIIGGAILNEASKGRQHRTGQHRTYADPATVAQNREVQTSLNYFGFPVGAVDGVLGSRSRTAISEYQATMGYPVTGRLQPYERDFLTGSYRRAIAGGPATAQMIAGDPMGPRGLLRTYQKQAAGIAPPPAVQPVPNTTVVIAPAAPAPAPVPATIPVMNAARAPGGTALPNFLGAGTGKSLASHCNKVSLLTSTNGGFVTSAAMTDPSVALNEQFCLARTYAIASGEDMAGRVSTLSQDQIAAQCDRLGPVLKPYVSALSFRPRAEVMSDLGGFVQGSGMSPEQLAGTARICLSVGYRTDNMDVALGSALLLNVLGEAVYGELLGHHLSQGFGTATRADLALDWYDAGLDAVARGAAPVFAPGQPERSELIRQAAYRIGGRSDGTALSVPAPVVSGQVAMPALPAFTVAD